MQTNIKEQPDTLITLGAAVNRVVVEKANRNAKQESQALANLADLLARRPDALEVLLKSETK